jgi:hypothetical protein
MSKRLSKRNRTLDATEISITPCPNCGRHMILMLKASDGTAIVGTFSHDEAVEMAHEILRDCGQAIPEHKGIDDALH